MNKPNKKIIYLLASIVVGIGIILFVSIQKDTTQDAILPTRDVEGLESYASTEEFCQDLTSSQEFDDRDREASFYETCMLQYR